jgi:hypothetical protein
MTVQVLNSGAWKPATPRGVLVGGVWVAPKKMYVLAGGAWRLVWEEAAAAEPPYLYAVDVEYLPGYEVKFTARLGIPEGDPNEAFMFRCVQMPRDGYTGRVFTKTWAFNAYGSLDCTLEDITGSPDRDRRTVSFKISPRA